MSSVHPVLASIVKKAPVNLSVPKLIEIAVQKGEGTLTSTGALAVSTGQYTGRSPKDKSIVIDPATEETVDWGEVNIGVARETFDRLLDRVLQYLDERDAYIFEGYAGANPRYRLPVRVVNEFAWQNLFIRHLLIPKSEVGEANSQSAFGDRALTVICAPGFKADPARDGTRSEVFVMLDLSRLLCIIGGTLYAGEMKKAVFTVMNHLLPDLGVLPMHCSANTDRGAAGSGPGSTALFFGLSGTGKTTLSSDANRALIGDDEHGWSDTGIFNFEGGCYAKAIGLNPKSEPEIWQAIRFGAVLENVLVDPESRLVDYSSDIYTENTRAAYPLHYIPGADRTGTAPHPKSLVFLTADAFGVMPPVARLDAKQAMYYFLSGYTSKVAGTERGVDSPTVVFSAGFGAPFLPRPPAVYAEMLGEFIRKYGSEVYMVNTGWIGGSYGTGRRIDLGITRQIVNAIVNGELNDVTWTKEPAFGLSIPTALPGVADASIFNPRSKWEDPAAYDRTARELVHAFAENFAKFSGVDPEIASAGPKSG